MIDTQAQRLRVLADPIRAAPRVETDRLVLRSFRREDLDAHAAKLSDPDVVRHLGGYAFNREDTWRRLTMAAGQWPLLGMGYWAVELKSEGRMVGEVGFEEGLRVARANPGLAVGLHLTLTDGVPVLPPRQIPSLTRKNGRFRDDMAALGLHLALSVLDPEPR